MLSNSFKLAKLPLQCPVRKGSILFENSPIGESHTIAWLGKFLFNTLILIIQFIMFIIFLRIFASDPGLTYLKNTLHFYLNHKEIACFHTVFKFQSKRRRH